MRKNVKTLCVVLFLLTETVNAIAQNFGENNEEQQESIMNYTSPTEFDGASYYHGLLPFGESEEKNISIRPLAEPGLPGDPGTPIGDFSGLLLIPVVLYGVYRVRKKKRLTD